MQIWGWVSFQTGNNRYEGPEVGSYLECLRNSKRLVKLEWNEQGESTGTEAGEGGQGPVPIVE